MSFVGKQFPNIEVNAMSDLGDTFKINVLSEAVNSKKKVLLFWYPKILLSYALPSSTLSKKH